MEENKRLIIRPDAITPDLIKLLTEDGFRKCLACHCWFIREYKTKNPNACDRRACIDLQINWNREEFSYAAMLEREKGRT